MKRLFYGVDYVKKLNIILNSLIITLCVVGCSTTSHAFSNAPDRIIEISNDNGSYGTSYIVVEDTKTNVEYLVIISRSSGRTSVTPLYSPDGRVLSAK